MAFADEPISRRDAASAAQANGANAGTSPPEPLANHANSVEPAPVTEPDAAAGRAPALTAGADGTTGVPSDSGAKSTVGICGSGASTDTDGTASGPAPVFRRGPPFTAADGAVLKRDEDPSVGAPGFAPRAGCRGADALVDVEPSGDPDPAAPPEPVRSAKAVGIAETAEPMPRATASAPTRPT